MARPRSNTRMEQEMLEIWTEDGTIRLLYHGPAEPVERIVIGGASPGECPPLISKAPVDPAAAVGEFAAIGGMPDGHVLLALHASQNHGDLEGTEDAWRHRVSYSNGLLERRSTEQAAFNRAAQLGAELGLFAEVMDERTGEVLATFEAGTRTYPSYPCEAPSLLATGNPMWDGLHPHDDLESTIYLH